METKLDNDTMKKVAFVASRIIDMARQHNYSLKYPEMKLDINESRKSFTLKQFINDNDYKNVINRNEIIEIFNILKTYSFFVINQSNPDPLEHVYTLSCMYD